MLGYSSQEERWKRIHHRFAQLQREVQQDSTGCVSFHGDKAGHSIAEVAVQVKGQHYLLSMKGPMDALEEV